MAPAAGCPAEEMSVTVVMALSPAWAQRPRPVRRRQEQPQRRGRRSHSWLPLSPSRFPRALSAGHTCQASREVGRVPPRRPKRRPHLGTSAIQLPSGGRCLLLLVFQAWPAASHPQSPSSGAERTDPPTPSGIPPAGTLPGQRPPVARFGSSYESLVTEATGPARLFKGPRNKNRTRYGTRRWFRTRRPRPAGCLVRSEQPPSTSEPSLVNNCVLGNRPETFDLHSRRGGPARINRFMPFSGDHIGRRTRCTRMNQAREGRQQSRETVTFPQRLTPRNGVLGKPNSPP